tara:strand:+ start:2614 stop:3126 length:513 start_codon:yes stop_codon:yes gene_type:complete
MRSHFEQGIYNSIKDFNRSNASERIDPALIIGGGDLFQIFPFDGPKWDWSSRLLDIKEEVGTDHEVVAFISEATRPIIESDEIRLLAERYYKETGTFENCPVPLQRIILMEFHTPDRLRQFEICMEVDELSGERILGEMEIIRNVAWEKLNDDLGLLTGLIAGIFYGQGL